MPQGLWLERLKNVLEAPLLKMGGTPLTLWTLLYIGALVILLFYFAAKLRSWVADRALARTRFDIGARQAAGSMVRYLILFLGLLVIIQTAGIDLTSLNVLAGAVGIGVGFGLQNIVGNFISGLIIMFERPIKVGDRIVVDDVEGDVVDIGARSTVVLTNDNINIIVPNSKFITENVVNWKYNDTKVRFRIPVGVAYGSDVRFVERLLLEVAQAEPDVLADPPPVVRFLAFGDSALELELRVWSTNAVNRKGKLISALNFAIYDTFREHGVVIPFPQREVHIRSRPEQSGT
ncbi:MAG: Mechanosensitive channel MscK precursor [Betaproteobacteria bacterium ADurb.Bin341]|nr:MAG: Mechanosensitive channel MscK precursor [Betaproteobacteria bacterium ADurb.Bin341]